MRWRQVLTQNESALIKNVFVGQCAAQIRMSVPHLGTWARSRYLANYFDLFFLLGFAKDLGAGGFDP